MFGNSPALISLRNICYSYVISEIFKLTETIIMLKANKQISFSDLLKCIVTDIKYQVMLFLIQMYALTFIDVFNLYYIIVRPFSIFLSMKFRGTSCTVCVLFP